MAPRPAAARDRHFMGQALELARGRLGRTGPNPAVGCVIVLRGAVVGLGATAPGGRPHAEPIALRMAGRRAQGATAYVSMEPCAHFGHTPPCAQALIASGIRRVVAGCIDPYPAVRGRGIAQLRQAGLEVRVGVLEQQCRRINEGFITRVRRGRPFTVLKLALSLDGRIATARGDSRWISCPQSRALVHRWRAECDAVMIGGATVRADNPRLTCRIKGGRDPARVIVDGALRSPPAARVFQQRSRSITLLVTTADNLRRARRRYRAARVEFLAAAGRGGRIALGEVMRQLAARGWSKVMIEGGARLAAWALEDAVVDRVAFFVAPLIIGGGRPAVDGLRLGTVSEAIALKNLSARQVGTDWLLEGDL